MVKPGKFLDDERLVLRLIMDFHGTNAATKVLEGYLSTLTRAHLVVQMSAADLVPGFYLFALPPSRMGRDDDIC